MVPQTTSRRISSSRWVMRRTSRGSSTSEKWSSSAARRDFRGRVSAKAIMGGSESGPPHRFREYRPCHLSYEFGALLHPPDDLLQGRSHGKAVLDMGAQAVERAIREP